MEAKVVDALSSILYGRDESWDLDSLCDFVDCCEAAVAVDSDEDAVAVDSDEDAVRCANELTVFHK